jgi:hypothetical protein
MTINSHRPHIKLFPCEAWLNRPRTRHDFTFRLTSTCERNEADFFTELTFANVHDGAAASAGWRDQGRKLRFVTDPAVMAKRMASQMLDKLEKSKGGQPKKNSSTTRTSTPEVSKYSEALDEIGVTKQDASRWRSVAEVPETVFARYVEQVAGRELQLNAGEKTIRSFMDVNARVLVAATEATDWALTLQAFAGVARSKYAAAEFSGGGTRRDHPPRDSRSRSRRQQGNRTSTTHQAESCAPLPGDDLEPSSWRLCVMARRE